MPTAQGTHECRRGASARCTAVAPTRAGDRRDGSAGGGLAQRIGNATLKMTCACFTIFIHTFSPGNTWLREQRQASHDCHLSVWKDAKTRETTTNQTLASPRLLREQGCLSAINNRNENCVFNQLPKQKANAEEPRKGCPLPVHSKRAARLPRVLRLLTSDQAGQGRSVRS